MQGRGTPRPQRPGRPEAFALGNAGQACPTPTRLSFQSPSRCRQPRSCRGEARLARNGRDGQRLSLLGTRVRHARPLRVYRFNHRQLADNPDHVGARHASPATARTAGGFCSWERGSGMPDPYAFIVSITVKVPTTPIMQGRGTPRPQRPGRPEAFAVGNAGQACPTPARLSFQSPSTCRQPRSCRGEARLARNGPDGRRLLLLGTRVRHA